MFKYRNVRSGRVLERPERDEWLDASAGWERVDEICDYAPEPVEPEADEPAEPADNKTPDAGADNNETEDD
jgi:hypothetical protein